MVWTFLMFSSYLISDLSFQSIFTKFSDFRHALSHFHSHALIFDVPEILSTASSCHLSSCKYPFIVHVAYFSSRQSSRMPKKQLADFPYIHVIYLASYIIFCIIWLIAFSSLFCFSKDRHSTYFICSFKYTTWYSTYHKDNPQ